MKCLLLLTLVLYIFLFITIGIAHFGTRSFCRMTKQQESIGMVYSGFIYSKKIGCWLGEPIGE